MKAIHNNKAMSIPNGYGPAGYAAQRLVLLALAWAMALAAFPAWAQALPTLTVDYEPVARERHFDGLVEAERRSTVSAQVSARIEDLPFDVDDYVERGDVIVRFRDQQAAADLKQAEAASLEARARLEESRSNYDRIARLFEQQRVSKADTDRATADQQSARARVEAPAGALLSALHALVAFTPLFDWIARDVLGEAERLVEAGVRELLVISQDTSAYGADLRYRLDFWGGRPVRSRMRELCEALGSLGVWVRLHYVYPYPHVDKIIPLMASGQILPYLDVPFQHGSPRILKRMRRPAAAENNLERIAAWRKICPELTIRSTFIVGFPGETDEDFEVLMDFLEEAQLDRVGCFTYSPVEGARANELDGAVPEEVKEERWHRFMQTQALISRNRLQRKVGSAQIVLVDSVEPDGATARSTADAPEIDGVVRIRDGHGLVPGEFVQVIVEDSDDYDLTARLAD